MQEKEIGILSIAGYDPCGGAGVLADIKTFESLQLQGCAVITSITFQNDVSFKGLEWMSLEVIENQLLPLFERFKFPFVKIGLIENLEMLNDLIKLLKKFDNEIKIIWDPILKASAGFDFHKTPSEDDMNRILKKVFLITPNVPEAITLAGSNDKEVCGNLLSEYCNVLIKGGHDEESVDFSTDVLYQNGVETARFQLPRIKDGAKHGSGCVLSSALSCFLQKGYDLQDACRSAQEFTASYLESSSRLLGKFNFIYVTE